MNLQQSSSQTDEPSDWEEFVALLESEWGAIKTWGEDEIDALFATAGTIVQTFSATAVAFVKQQSETFLADITAGKMSLPDAATAVLNAAEAQGLSILEGVASNALMGLIGTFVAGL